MKCKFEIQQETLADFFFQFQYSTILFYFQVSNTKYSTIARHGDEVILTFFYITTDLPRVSTVVGFQSSLC